MTKSWKKLKTHKKVLNIFKNPHNLAFHPQNILRILTLKIFTIAAKIITKNLFTKKCFGAINFVIITKESLYKANSLACFLVKRDPPVAATLQRKSSDGIIFVIITKIITKEIVPRNYFVIISARMVEEKNSKY